MAEDRESQEKGLYGVMAKYYDQIYHWKDYRKEAIKVERIINRYKRSSGNTLLDVACGTGKHISYLRKEFSCVGIDVSAEMLAVAKKNLPGIRFVQGNMVDFDLGKQFDVVLCLFSSIGHLQTRYAVRKAVANFARHMKKGGVLIVEPWIRKSRWMDKTVHMQIYDSDSLKIARVSYSWMEGGFSVLDEGYVIGERGRGISYVKDRHRMRFFEVGPTLAAMRKAGLEPSFTEDSLEPKRGLIIATKS
jgi:ubiquinone/menaquinone biosynthesis C-methylase UbiE